MKTLIFWIQSIKPLHALFAILGLALSLTLSSFFVEHFLEAVPCTMCWWQRYTHWALWGLSLLGVFAYRYISPVFMLRLCLCVALISAVIGLYQGLGQVGLLVLPEVCGGSATHLAEADELLMLLTTNAKPVPDCTDLGYTFFGVSIAWWNFIIMSLMVLVISLWMKGPLPKQYKKR